MISHGRSIEVRCGMGSNVMEVLSCTFNQRSAVFRELSR
jgi:hypothetical protein